MLLADGLSIGMGLWFLYLSGDGSFWVVLPCSILMGGDRSTGLPASRGLRALYLTFPGSGFKLDLLVVMGFVLATPVFLSSMDSTLFS